MIRGRPATEIGEQALRYLARALLEGQKGWWHAAEETLEVMSANTLDVRKHLGDYGIGRIFRDEFHGRHGVSPLPLVVPLALLRFYSGRA